jgi:hypothetical protein
MVDKHILTQKIKLTKESIRALRAFAIQPLFGAAFTFNTVIFTYLIYKILTDPNYLSTFNTYTDFLTYLSIVLFSLPSAFISIKATLANNKKLKDLSFLIPEELKKRDLSDIEG